MAVRELKIALGCLLSKPEMEKHGVDIDCLNDIQDFLWVYLCRVLAHPTVVGKFTPCVNWFTNPGEITDTDLVCYFVAEPGQSVIKSLGHTVPSSDIGGLTAIGTPDGTISEVYVANNFPTLKLANMAFHELMHNKTGKDNAMHTTKGTGMGVSPATECSILTATDVSMMAARLTTPVKQYADKLPGDVAAKFVIKDKKKPVAKMVCGTGNVVGTSFLDTKLILPD